MASASPSSETLIQTLITRGWCFGDIDQVKTLIAIHSALNGDSTTVESIESELSNSDLRSIGGNSLPDSSLLRKSSHLQGPKVLQISSARDISRSSIADSSGNSSSGRLLRLKLTDGHSEITAIEYSHIPSISGDVVPGTKIRLENKVVTRSGILCLNPKVVTVLGGVVQSLYEEWQMNKKYSGFSRSSLKESQKGESSGPPPFEKLQIGAPSNRQPLSQYPGSTLNRSGVSVVEKSGSSGSRQMNRSQNYVLKVDNKDNDTKSIPLVKRNEEKLPSSEARPKGYFRPTSNNPGPSFVEKGESSVSVQMNRSQNYVLKADSMNNDAKSASIVERTEEKLPSSEARPKEVSESVPVQNQAAAQKLLQKMNQPNWDNRNSRGGRRYNRGRGKEEEDSHVLTLDERERRKAGANPLMSSRGGRRYNRGREKEEEDSHVLTLDEWERRKAGANPSMRNEFPDVRQDEDLAWQLQNQFDLEDHSVQRGPQMTAAENIKMSMFKFERDEPTMEFRGRGNTRGRGRGRGWGRGRGGGFG